MNSVIFTELQLIGISLETIFLCIYSVESQLSMVMARSTGMNNSN